MEPSSTGSATADAAAPRRCAIFCVREQPDYFFCGHIHEAAGVRVEMGRTQAMNVGKQGWLLDLG